MSRLLAALAALCVIAAPAFAQNKGSVRGAEMSGYGRMIFSFDNMQKATAAISSGVLVVSFDNSVAVDLEKIPVDLPSYVGIARRDPDGKGLRFALTRPLRVNLMEAGEKLYLDLMPENWTGQPPAMPQDVVDDLARRARAAEDALRKAERKRFVEEVRALPARVAIRPDLTRIVFEMPIVVPVSSRRDGDRLEVTFDAAFKVDTVKLKAQLGASAKAVEATAEGGVTRVMVTPPDKADIVGFREDDTFIVDIVAPEPQRRRRLPEASQPEQKTIAAQPQPEARSPVAAAMSSPRETPARAPQTTAPQTIAPQPAAPEKPAVVRPAPAGPVRPTASKDGATIRINFPFADKPPAAAFERFGAATLVFETDQTVELGETPQIIRDAGGAWSFDQKRGAQILRLTFNEPKLLRIAPEGDGWMATIGDNLAAASEPIAIQRSIDESGRTTVSAQLQRAGRTHWLDDPDTGERIAVTTARAPLRSVAKPYRFAEFELAPTAHGVAVIAFADDLIVRAGVDDVVIERGGGLAVSAKIDRPAAAGARDGAVSAVFDRAQWEDALAGVTRDRLRALELKAAEAQRGRRAAARMEMARFLFANGLLSETEGALRLILQDQPDVARDRTFNVLRLATAVRMERFAEARKMLAENGLNDDPEALPWRSIADARQRLWPRALAGFNAAEHMIEAYPDTLQAQMRALWARAAVEAHDLTAAQEQLEAIDRLDRGAVSPEEIALLKARIDEEQGRIDEALAAYARIFDGGDRQAAAEAGLRSALRGLADKTMSRADAIARLETVAAIWRGDGAVEPEIIAALGRLYAEENRWRDAFIIARRGDMLYPDNDKIRALHDQAATMFEDLFTGGHGDALDRVQALALFYDFKDFTPPGRQGDEIVRRLSERLVQFDLLDHAAELLQHQIDHRVTGPYRSILAARLAVIYLMNRKPAAALNALTTTRLPDLAYNTRRARNLLEARALSDLSRTDLALDIAAAESGPDVDRLTADIQWQGRRWREAGETYERILGDRWKDRAALGERERADVMRAGIAYSLADEALSIDRLRGKYGAGMSDSADARAFQLVTSPSPARAGEFRELARQVARADTLIEFLDEYRKRYPDIPPPARTVTTPPPASASDAAAKPQTEGAAPAGANAPSHG